MAFTPGVTSITLRRDAPPIRRSEAVRERPS
jgi:hypothetical protein